MIQKDVFPDHGAFAKRFGQLGTSAQLDELQGLLRPRLLRRMKEDVEASLPPRSETILEVGLTLPQKKYYKALYEKNHLALSSMASKASLNNVAMQLRKCCNHPYLIRGAVRTMLSPFFGGVRGKVRNTNARMSKLGFFMLSFSFPPSSKFSFSGVFLRTFS